LQYKNNAKFKETKMKLIAKKISYNFKKSDTIVMFLSEDHIKDISAHIPSEISYINENIDFKYFSAKPSETIFLPLSGYANVIICGIGPLKDITGEKLRNNGASVTAIARDKKISSLQVLVPSIDKINDAEVLETISEGLYLSNYSFNKYKSNNDEKPLVEKANFISDIKNASGILREIETICKNSLLNRDLVNETSYESDPMKIAAYAKKLSSIEGVSCKVYGKAEIEKMKMGLLLAVNKGSKIPPQLVVLKYTGNPRSKKYMALVGKGITFDSGGLNLKTSGHIETMRMDMAGASTALHTLKAAAELKLKKNIYAVIPLTENMLSNDAYRPGDIFTSYSGKTVEIGNTDAEGRLILADALTFTANKLKPEYIVDMATLTGACLVALGETVAAALSTDDELAKMISSASEKTGEMSWRLPFFSDYEDNMKSDIADISNMAADRNAGTINAAVFLKNFVEDIKWAHIDIAGTAWYSKPRGYRPKNATGFGVRLMIDVIKNWRS